MTALTDKPADRPSPAEQPSPPDPGGARFVAVRANLMPEEIVAGRRTEQLRRRVVVGVAGLVAFLVLLYGFSWWQTHSARSDLEAAQQQQSTLQAQTRKFAPLVDAKSRTSTITDQLHRLMTGDLSWRAMLTTLRTTAPTGVTVTQVTGNVNTTAGPTGDTGYQALNQSGQQPVGSLTLTGSARDKRAVADYADALAKVKGLASPFVSNVSSAGSGSGGGTTYTVDVLVTTAALGGRYAAAPTPSTGGN